MKGDIVNACLSENRIVCVDVGAKGGVFQLSTLDKYCVHHGFEPNPSEYAQLKQTNTQQYFPYGLSETGGEKEFYITRHSSYSSLLKSNLESFKNHFGKVRSFSKWLDDFQIVKSVTIDTKTLDAFILEEQIASIDFLKLDTQGTELAVLKGAQQALLKKQISVIFAEVTFIEVYKGQNLFSDLDHYLKAQDYEFIDCRFYPDDVTNDLFSKSKYERSRFSVGGDAVYVPKLKTIQNDKLKCLKIGIVLSSLRYLSMATVYLEHGGLCMADIKKIHRSTYRRSARHWIKRLLPPVILYVIKKIKNL